jgi:hypothetical protein
LVQGSTGTAAGGRNLAHGCPAAATSRHNSFAVFLRLFRELLFLRRFGWHLLGFFSGILGLHMRVG